MFSNIITGIFGGDALLAIAVKVVVLLIGAYGGKLLAKLFKTQNALSVAKHMVVIADDIVLYFKATYGNSYMQYLDEMLKALIAQFPALSQDVLSRVLTAAIERNK